MQLAKTRFKLAKYTRTDTAQEMNFSIAIFFSKCDPQETVDLVTFTEEILNEKLHFLCSVNVKHARNYQERSQTSLIFHFQALQWELSKYLVKVKNKDNRTSSMAILVSIYKI